ncbi:mitochondrial import receptor subunit TOM20 homolog [Hydractinia symbiolongicarpus]|uniref:mitochondrial import receptor subunit TOM20 homolog n=1 Tax=Hydractinia symbiolongicarpus TaxID=13093 RepID=UPI00254AB17B|nr:mitochondrial import receptor subunit TOM20 homolog [Hydractinia symbiolongicarpus]
MMPSYGHVATIAAGIAGVTFLGYCIYFDRKRRSDPLFKQKLRERRANAKKNVGKSSSDLNLPDMKDQEAVQKFFLEEVQKGEEYLGQNDFDNCVKHLTNAIAVCGQPQQLLNVFKQTLPPNVFQMLIQNLALLGSVQMQQMQKAATSGDTDGLD